MTIDQQPAEGLPLRLPYFPISFFGVSMGVFGLALALRSAGLEEGARIAGWSGAGILCILLLTYLSKAVLHPNALKAEWSNPVALAFFPAISISALLFAAFLREPYHEAANIIWIAGAILQAILTVIVIATWIGHRNFGPGHLSPAWFIPAVGNVVAPLAGVPLGHVEVSWYFFSVGLLFWIVLLTVVFNRLIFHDPMPAKLRPTMVILIAPPAVGFLAWLQLHHGVVDDAGRLFLNAGYFFTAVVLVQSRYLIKLPFALSFWALSFPMAAITTASFKFAAVSGSVLHSYIGYGLLIILGLVMAGLVFRTIKAIVNQEICRPE